jgi:hypothetical protein
MQQRSYGLRGAIVPSILASQPSFFISVSRGHLVAPAGGKDFGLFPVSRQPNEISEIKFRHLSVRFPTKLMAVAWLPGGEATSASVAQP